MKVLRARLHRYRLRLRAPVETAHGRLHERCGVLLELAAGDGLAGFGDACPIAGFGMETLARAEEALAALGRAALGRDAACDGDALREVASARFADAPGARAAFDCALGDLAARAAGVSLADWLTRGSDVTPSPSLAVAALVVGDDPEAVRVDAAARAARGFETFKLKIGARPWPGDLARLRALRGAVGQGARVRVDANGAYREAEAQVVLDELAALGVELIEQPVEASDVSALARLRARGRVRIAADEAACSEDFARRVLDAGAADVLVLKPAALGGPQRALALAAAARAAGCDVFVTSLLDSAVGVAAAIETARALPGERPADGLATGDLFEADFAAPPRIVGGRLRASCAPGLGVVPAVGALARLALGPPIELAP